MGEKPQRRRDAEGGGRNYGLGIASGEGCEPWKVRSLSVFVLLGYC